MARGSGRSQSPGERTSCPSPETRRRMAMAPRRPYSGSPRPLARPRALGYGRSVVGRRAARDVTAEPREKARTHIHVEGTA
jgi:hypothetical protein